MLPVICSQTRITGTFLQAIHGDAPPSAVFYVSAILALYLMGLLVILAHYMNSSYGAWNWSLIDVWREVSPRNMGQFLTRLRKSHLSCPKGGKQAQQQLCK